MSFNGRPMPMADNNMPLLLMGAACCCCLMLVLMGGGFYLYTRPAVTPAPVDPYANQPLDPIDYTEPPAAAAAAATAGIPTCGMTYRAEWESRDTPPYDPNSCRNELLVKNATCLQYQAVESPPGSGKWEWLRRGPVAGCTPTAGGWSRRDFAGVGGGAGGGGGIGGAGGNTGGSRQVINAPLNQGGTQSNAMQMGARRNSMFGPGGVFGTTRNRRA